MKKLIENSKNYFVTTEGEIYSGEKKLHCNRKASYKSVRISYVDGKYFDKYIHRLVAEAFIPNPENKPIVNHIDGDKHNNRLENLEWVTYSENSKHASELGLIRSGPESQKAILSTEQVHAICRKLVQGYRVKDLVIEFGVSQPVISSIRAATRYTEIASLYTFPPRKRALSVNTVLWICNMLEIGKSVNEIVKMSTNPLVDRIRVYNIKVGRTYKDITKNFNFVTNK